MTTDVGRLLDVVELVLGSVGLDEGKVETDTTDHSNDSDGTVVPYEERILGKTDESLGESRGDSGGGESDGLNGGLHVLWGLGVGILELGDRGKNFRHTDEDVRKGLHPHGDVGCAVSAGINSLVRVISTWRHLVDISLGDGGCYHGEGSENETTSDLLDGAEVEAGLTNSWVDDMVHDGNQDDDGNWVQVVENIVWHATEDHVIGLRCKI